jgi:branched-chain amino acid transport system ATP-binding protein/neutral amino acid transport system ATP-binding protein
MARQVDPAQAESLACCAQRRTGALQGARASRASRAPEISRLGLAFVPQERNVFGAMSVAENLEIGRLPRRRPCSRRAAELYERFPMLADKRRAAARTLSGGQRQILAMAIALMNAPTCCCSTSRRRAQPRAAEELFGTIIALNQVGVAILMVEQNALEALAVSARGLCAGAGPRRARRAGDELADDPTVRDLFLGGECQPMLGRKRWMGNSMNRHVRARAPHCSGVRRGGALRLAGAGRADQDRHADAADRRRRPYGPRWPRSAAAVVER